MGQIYSKSLEYKNKNADAKRMNEKAEINSKNQIAEINANKELAIAKINAGKELTLAEISASSVSKGMSLKGNLIKNKIIQMSKDKSNKNSTYDKRDELNES